MKPAGTQTTRALQLHALTPRGLAPLELTPTAAGLHDAMEILPDAVYSALRTFGRARFLALPEHLDRTQRSLDGLGWNHALDRARLSAALDTLARGYEHGEARIRFDVLPRPATIQGLTSDIFLGIQPHTEVPPELMERGVRVDYAPHLTRPRPLIKTTDFVRARKPFPLGTPERFEHVLCDPAGRLLECSSSNLLFVRGDELLYAGDGVLEGITQKTILRLAPSLGLMPRAARVHRQELGSVQECLLTSSFRGPVPIVKIEDAVIGDGRVGARTKAIVAAYYANAAREARAAV